MARRRGAKMCLHRGCGGGDRNLISKVLLSVPFVPSCLLLTAKLVIAPSVSAPLVANISRSVSSAVQEPLLTEEVLVALQEIARASKRGADLLSKNWPLLKIAVLQFGVLFVTTILAGVATLYLADLGRKRWPHWESLRSLTLSIQLAALGDQIAAAAERMTTTTMFHANEVAGLRDQVAMLEREEMKRKLELREEALRNSEKKLELMKEALRNSEPHREDVWDSEDVWDPIEGEVVTAA